jgi:AcrR family transcriptional regulator
MARKVAVKGKKIPVKKVAKKKTVAKKSDVKKVRPEKNAEQKIVEAAQKLFTEKGYHATKTRDIAQEAGINLALLNYYFRSKEKLFEIIMKENTSRFMQVIIGIINNESTSIEQKLELLVENYIDMLLVNPDTPLFILSHAKQDDQRLRMREKMMESFFMKQVMLAKKAGKIGEIDPLNLMMNLVAMTIFPFIARHLLQGGKGVSSAQFNAVMEQRKKLIPKWIGAMLKVE